MRRTNQAVAVGAAMFCLALAAQPARASTADPAEILQDSSAPAPLVQPQFDINYSPTGDETPAFVWASDVSVMPPPYVRAEGQAHIVPPSAQATAIPLPAAAWTGFASLAGLGAIALIRRLRRLQ